jgi:hypothetical protein
MKKIKLIRLTLLSLFLLLVHAGMAQTEAESGTGTLYIQSQSGKEVIPVVAGTTISVKYRHNPKLYRDIVLQDVMDTSAVFGVDTVGLQFVDEVVVLREKTQKVGRKLFWSSVIITVAFYATLLLGIAFLFSNSGLGVILVTVAAILSIPAAFAFPLGLIAGIVLLAVAKKRYSIVKGYRFSGNAVAK